MVKHIILWQLKDELSDAEKAAVYLYCVLITGFNK